MSRQNLHGRVPRRTQQGFYSTRLGRLKADRLRVYRIILLADGHDRLERATEDLGIAVGCQAHELRGVVGREAKITADDLPDEPKRMRIVEYFNRLYARTDGLRRVEAAASPMPSMMRMAARSKPDGKYAEAAWA